MFRTSSHAALLGLATLAALGLAAAAPQAAHAQIVVSGHHDNNPNPPGNNDGYDADGAGTTYIVDSTATFNNDANNGFDAEGNAIVIAGPGVQVTGDRYGFVGHGNTNITINGGTYDNEVDTDPTHPVGRQGLAVGVGSFNAGEHATMTINGGDFSHDDSGVNTSGDITLTVNGGNFTDDTAGIEAFGGTINVFGGTFGGGSSTSDFFDAGTNDITFYGQFDDPQTGKPLTPGQIVLLDMHTPITGQLENDSFRQTITLNLLGGGGRIVDVAVAPEPSQFAALGVGLLGLAGLAFKARKRSIARG